MELKSTSDLELKLTQNFGVTVCFREISFIHFRFENIYLGDQMLELKIDFILEKDRKENRVDNNIFPNFGSDRRITLKKEWYSIPF